MQSSRSSERRKADIPARLVVDGGGPLAVLITDISRGGCRVEPTGDIPAARSMAVEVAGWRPLLGRTVWSRAGQTGCIFDPKIGETDYEAMIARAGDGVGRP